MTWGETLRSHIISAVDDLTITPMFEEPVVVLEGQPLRVAFETNLDINSGPGVTTNFVSDPQGRGTSPDLSLEVGVCWRGQRVK